MSPASAKARQAAYYSAPSNHSLAWKKWPALEESLLLSPRDLPRLTSGPGRLAQAFGITRTRDNGADLTSPASGLWIGEDGFRAKNIRTTPRIGITKAADRPLRFILAGNPFISGQKTPREPEHSLPI